MKRPKQRQRNSVRCDSFFLSLRRQCAACGSVVLKRGAANCNGAARGGWLVLSEFAAAVDASARTLCSAPSLGLSFGLCGLVATVAGCFLLPLSCVAVAEPCGGVRPKKEMQNIVWGLLGGAVAAEWGCRFSSCAGEYAAALFLLAVSGANVPASDNLQVPSPRRLKEAEVSAAAFAGCTPCGPVVWQTVSSRNSRAPRHVLGAAYICVAGDNAVAFILLFAGERTGGWRSAPSHLSELRHKIPPRRGSQFRREWVISTCGYAHTELWGSECHVQYEKKRDTSSQLLCVLRNLHGLPRGI
ncbi:hypothetical protein TraAM80_10137 [Trypanosoma rangeli]|uniref:Uncharacterized protein n=1 Tax=Trypanosoma rangeli TaxID=5698 RepID=A0A422MRC4_TRYRA|nr:uncharacterized protein TraAM80_10137 [Trypanosoma rangeli]RNE95744.1 hypothetical protein TraAM80_10137 [Trypanosoma rangeli]|eukprot:RNE95744.1 hypothetical protein TraAM80_10137 [Trypanosoma rangeli]